MDPAKSQRSSRLETNVARFLIVQLYPCLISPLPNGSIPLSTTGYSHQVFHYYPHHNLDLKRAPEWAQLLLQLHLPGGPNQDICLTKCQRDLGNPTDQIPI